MTATDYLISLLLISVVIRQLRGRHLTFYTLFWPVALVVYLGSGDFKGMPTGGNDIAFIATVGILGAALGVVSALLTKVYKDKNGKLIGKATTSAAALWILGTGARVAFGLYATHGGGDSVVRISSDLRLTSAQVWINALLLMTLFEVGGRTAVLAIRTYRFHSQDSSKEKSHSAKVIPNQI